MPRIPLASFTPTDSPQQSARANVGMLDRQYEAGKAIGAGIQSIGMLASDFAAKKQAAVDFGETADAMRKMDAAESDYMESLKKNGDEKTYLPDWQKRVGEVEKNLNLAKLSNSAKLKVQERLMDWKQNSSQTVRSVATAREIMRAGDSGEAAAKQLFEDGRNAEAIALIKEGEKNNLYDPKKASDLIAGLSNGAAYGRIDRQLSDVSQLPPTKQRTELKRIEEELTATDESGKPKMHATYDENGVRIAGLGNPARTDLIRNIRAKNNAAEKSIENEMRRLFGVRMSSSADEFNRQAAESKKAGLIDIEPTAEGINFYSGDNPEGSVAGPEFDRLAAGASKDLESGQKSEAAAQARGQAFLKKQREQQREELASMTDRATSGKLTEEDVSLALSNGKITRSYAEQLKGTVRAQAELYGTRDDKKNRVLEPQKLAQVIEKYATMTPQQKDQLSFETRRGILASIDQAKDMTEAQRAGAMKQYLDAMNVDLQGWSKDGKAQRPHYNGRKLSSTEVMVRASLGETYAKVKGIGKGWAGQSMINDEAELEGFFTASGFTEGPASAKEAEVMRERIVKRINTLAASQITSSLFAQ